MLISARLHPDFRPGVEAVLEALCAAYPNVKFDGLQLYGPPAGDESLGCTDGNRILLNAGWFTEPEAKLDQAIVEGRVATPPGVPLWHGGIGSLEHEVERLVCHEFGHLVAQTIGKSAQRFADRGHRAVLAEPDIAVSGYAITDPEEWFAEVFAAMRLGAAGSRQVAEMAAFLERAIK